MHKYDYGITKSALKEAIKVASDNNGTLTTSQPDYNRLQIYEDEAVVADSDIAGAETTDLSKLFYESKITEIDLRCIDTASVTDMSSMFYGCSSLTSLDVSGFDTANVAFMSEMFSGCSGITRLDLSKFDMSKIISRISMAQMFYVDIPIPLSIKTIDAKLLAYDYKSDNRIVALVDTSKVPSEFDFSNTGWTGGAYGTSGNPWKIDYSKDQTFEAPNVPGGTSSVNMNLTATDSRLNDGEGFTYKVSRTAFEGDNSHEALANTNLFFEVSLSNSEGWELTGSLEGMTADQEKATGSVGKVINLDQDNVSKTVMRAEKGKSGGTSIANIGGVFLTVPAASHKQQDTYKSIVT